MYAKCTHHFTFQHVTNHLCACLVVADHMYRMAMCSFLITDPNINRER